MKREEKIKQVQVVSSGIEAVQRVCPLIEAPKVVLSGLSELLNTTSPVINGNTQKALRGTLTRHTLNYFYLSLRSGFEVPNYLRMAYFKNELSKNDPTTIQALRVEKFKFIAYCIKFLEYDTNGFYLIIHQKDIVRLLLDIRKSNELSKFQKESREFDFEKLDDVLGAYDIRNSYEYDKIFEMLNDEERKLFFTYSKKVGVTKENRKLIKQLTAHHKPFYVIIEELEEEVDRTKEALNKLETKDTEKVKYGIRRLKDRLYEKQKELWDLTEEHNSETVPTELEDY